MSFCTVLSERACDGTTLSSGRNLSLSGVSSLDSLHPIVNNSAFVNAISQMALSAPEEAFALLGKPMSVYKHFADSVYLPYDSQRHFHPAFDGYTYCTYSLVWFIPQHLLLQSFKYLSSSCENLFSANPQMLINHADAVLLGYPLQQMMDSSTRKNDLTVYQAVSIKMAVHS